MQHARRNPHGLERAEAADAQQQFLADTYTSIAAVQTRSELSILGRVTGNIGIEQQQNAPADLYAPDFREHESAARFNLNGHRLPVHADGGFHRQLADIVLQVRFLLPTAHIQALAEIALAVEEPDADQRDVEVGGALDVIARQDAQAAGIDRKRFV